MYIYIVQKGRWVREGARQLYVSACLIDWLVRQHPDRVIYINIDSLKERVQPRNTIAWKWAKATLVYALRLKMIRQKQRYKWIPTDGRKKRLKELLEVSRRLLLLLS